MNFGSVDLVEHLYGFYVATTSLLRFTTQLIHSGDVCEVYENVRISFSETNKHEIEASS